MKALGLGIIGLHHQHARWYNPLWENLPQYKPLAVAESDTQFLESENTFFGYDPYSDYNELLSRSDIDAVIIWLPHKLMPRAVAAAAAAGKHVIVEKPCCADVAGAEQIVEISQKYPHICISAPYCWRTHLVSERIKELLAGGEIGTLTSINARLNAGRATRYLRDNQTWMFEPDQGGGPMWNLGVHWIDFIRWVSGLEITEASGFVSPPQGKPERYIEDSAHAVMKLTNNATVMLEASYSLGSSYPGTRDIAITLRGTKGVIKWNPAWQGNTDTLLVVREDYTLGNAEQCQYLQIESPTHAGYCGHMAHAWLKDFYNCTQHVGKKPQVTPEDILAAVKVANAFYRSVNSGKAEAV